MKQQLSVLLLTLFALFDPAIAKADDGALRKADAAFATLAKEKRAAALKITCNLGAGRTGSVFGAFISKDGLALVPLQAVVLGKVPTVETADGKPLKFGSILKLFPEQGVALMKFNHHPEMIASLAKEEPEIGEIIALLQLAYDTTWPGKLPPIVGPIMVKRCEVTTNFKRPGFIKVLSLGSGLSREQGEFVTNSSGFAINANGELVAFLSSIKPYSSQILINLRTIVGVANEINQPTNERKGLEFPLSEASNPIDPAMNDPDYLGMAAARLQRDQDKFLRLLKSLLERHPKSFVLRMQAATNRLIVQSDTPLLGLEDFPEPDPDDPNKAFQYSQHLARGAILMGKGGKENLEKSVREMIAAIECAPEDLPEIRVQLAFEYQDAGRLADAEKLYREAYPYMSDDIHFIEKFEKLLTQQGRIDEADKMSNRLFDLSEIYRQR